MGPKNISINVYKNLVSKNAHHNILYNVKKVEKRKYLTLGGGLDKFYYTQIK